MSTHKHIDQICVAVLLLTILLTALFMFGDRFGIQPVSDGDQEDESGYFTGNDLAWDWNRASATTIDLSASTVTGGGAYFFNQDLILSGSGYFILSGAMEGRVLVDAGSGSKVWILLDGAQISCPDDACFQVLQAKKVFLTLEDGSDNHLISGPDFSPEALEAGRDGAVFTSDNLTINGTGSLTVQAGYRHGIEANDDLRITGGDIRITAAGDGINANDSFRLCGANLNIDAADDGLVVKEPSGFFYQESGSLSISCLDDGIRSSGDVTVAGGSCSIDAPSKGIRAGGIVTASGGSVQIDNCATGMAASDFKIDADVTIHARSEDYKTLEPDQNMEDLLSVITEQSETLKSAKPPVVYTAGTWMWTAGTFLVILLGIGAALIFKRH